MTSPTSPFRITIPVLLLAPMLVAAVALARPARPSRDDCAALDPARAAVELNCTTLIPTPDLARASGLLLLRSPPTPFGVSVTRDGRPRRLLTAWIVGLPDPRSLGDYSAYVAWVTPLSMDTVIRLGEVRNGSTALGEVTMEQYRILISAERSASSLQRVGRLVLRGTSPGVRLLAHRDLTQPSALGGVRDEAGGARAGVAGGETGGGGDSSDMHAMHGTPSSRHSGEWTMPPMPDWMRPMAGMHSLRPDVAPWLPGGGTDPMTLPLARPREVVALRSGDTLHLEAGLVRRSIAGRALVMYGYNGQYPGPLLRVQQGATILVDFHNDIDQPSAVHWHGVRLENRSDGAVGVTQAAVEPGGRFLYRVTFRDAGIYWYHPHVREDTQQDLGLAGNILVAPTARNYWSRVNRDEVLLLDDLLLDEHGLIPYGREAPTHALSGRHGNVTLVNGDPRWTLVVRRGEVVRFHLTNAASARFFNVSFDTLALKVVGADIGRFEQEVWAPSAVIAPAERYVVEVRFNTPGDVPLLNRVQALDHMAGWFLPQTDTLGVVRVLDQPAEPDLGASFARLRRNAEVTSEFASLRRLASRPATHALTLALRVDSAPAAVAAMLWGTPVAADWNDGMPIVNWSLSARRTTWILRDAASGAENMNVHWRFSRGELVRMQVFNDPLSAHAMAHPIHVHGQRFLILSRNGALSDNMAWKDTAVIPVGETVELLVEMSNPGRWMIHCHIAEHLGSGMMTVFDVQ
ncbi:MAG: multicopper oxidase family protein [Gemmatimonadota bacterium]